MIIMMIMMIGKQKSGGGGGGGGGSSGVVRKWGCDDQLTSFIHTHTTHAFCVDCHCLPSKKEKKGSEWTGKKVILIQISIL